MKDLERALLKIAKKDPAVRRILIAGLSEKIDIRIQNSFWHSFSNARGVLHPLALEGSQTAREIVQVLNKAEDEIDRIFTRSGR